MSSQSKKSESPPRRISVLDDAEHVATPTFDIRPDIRALVDPTEEELRHALRITVESRFPSDPHAKPIAETPENRFRILKRFLKDPTSQSILGTTDSFMLTALRSALMGRLISDAQKVELATTFLTTFRLVPDHELSQLTGAPDLTVEVELYSAGLSEARRIGHLLEERLSEEQALGIARTLKGMTTQRRMREVAVLLHNPDLSGSLNTREREFLSSALRRIAEWKRREFAAILTPKQMAELYDRHQYDSTEYWRRRVNE